MLLARPLERPVLSLICLFVSWKLLICLVAYASPGSGYDSSTSLLFNPPSTLDSHTRPTRTSPITNIWLELLRKLARWDAIYFATISQRGYIYEQEWAFGWGFTKFISLLTRGIRQGASSNTSPVFEASTAIALANVTHLASALCLYRLTRAVFSQESRRAFALITASLHIITPAGLFLSAPYAESPFACLAFMGYAFYVSSLQADRQKLLIKRDVHVLVAGAMFGAATTFRSNGILNGAPFLYDALISFADNYQSGPTVRGLRRLFSLGLGGIFVATGLILPQWLAYQEFCRARFTNSTAGARPWCTRFVPSIYTWAQDHYWNVGFLRYWTVSNVPLFLLAAPMLLIMTTSSLGALRGNLASGQSLNSHGKIAVSTSARQIRKQELSPAQVNLPEEVLRRFAVPQLLLTVLALTSYHVQIITRISSGYVVWYWWIADTLHIEQPGGRTQRKSWEVSQLAVRWMVIYALVQGGLFSSFLPPA